MEAYLLQISTDKILGTYHPLIAHAAILLFTLALVCDLIGWLGKERAISIGTWLIMLGATLCYPAIVTGSDAAKDLDPNLIFLKFHIKVGYGIVIYSSLYALLRLAAFFEYLKLHTLIYIILTLGLVYLSSWNSTLNLK